MLDDEGLDHDTCSYPFEADMLIFVIVMGFGARDTNSARSWLDLICPGSREQLSCRADARTGGLIPHCWNV